MIEIELFYKIVEAEIRRKHIEYLKKQKCLPEGAVQLLSDEDREMPDFEHINVGDKLKYVKRYNKGIETALKVLQKEFKAFESRLRAESEKGKKF